MGWQKIWRLLKSDYVRLVPILALAFYIAFIPHASYPYPVHVDEWMHLAESRAMLASGSTTFTDPFAGEGVLTPFSNLETGFQLFWGVFQKVSGISGITVFTYFPGIVFMLTVFSVYIMARRQGFGWEAALITCLIPTTVGILGPAFLVPVAMGLLFIPLSIFVAFNFKTWWSYITLFLFTAFLISIHAPSAICLVIILAPYILLSLKGNFRHSAGITLALVIPFLAPFPWIFKLLQPTWESLFSPVYTAQYVQLPLIIPTYGYFPIALCLIGVMVLVIRRGRENLGLALGLFLMLLMFVVFFTFHRGVPIVYERGLMFGMLMISIVAGAGLMGLREIKLPEKFSQRLRMPLPLRNVGIFICLALIILPSPPLPHLPLTLATTIPARLNISYYHMIDEQDYEAFKWIEQNVGTDYKKAILEPWKATAFTAITLKSVYTRIHSYPKPEDTKASEFLQGGCSDTDFLRENGISIVYSRWECNNPDLVQVRENIYLLKPSGSQ